MHLKKKIAFSLIVCLFFLSLFTSIPLGLAAPIGSHIGHDFSEEYWSILYDFAGNYLEKDYNPGPLSNSVSDGLTDDNTDVDSKFFIAWNFSYSNIPFATTFTLSDQYFWMEYFITWDLLGSMVK